MPLVVDHEQRRAAIAEVVKTMIAETGIASVTVRAVAKNAGFSSTIVSHYFRDKQDLLISAFASILEESPVKVESLMKKGASTLDCFDALLPINARNLRDWQAWFGFWGIVTHDPLMAEERLAGLKETQTLFGQILTYGISRNEMPENVDISFHANRLQIFMNGLVSIVIMQPEAWTAKKQREALAWQLDMIRQHPTGGI
jgi:TetR/AcrR family transcriptional repressor of bet genes